MTTSIYAEKPPYSPTWIMDVYEGRLVTQWEFFEPLSEQAQAWKDGGATADEWLEFLSGGIG